MREKAVSESRGTSVVVAGARAKPISEKFLAISLQTHILQCWGPQCINILILPMILYYMLSYLIELVIHLFIHNHCFDSTSKILLAM